jgi:hypothetical protein
MERIRRRKGLPLAQGTMDLQRIAVRDLPDDPFLGPDGFLWLE